MAKRNGPMEKFIERYLVDEIGKAGGFTRKYVSPGHRGVPDRIVFLNGVYFVELKAIDGRISALQHREMTRMAEQKAIVGVISSTDDVDEFIKVLKRDFK